MKPLDLGQDVLSAQKIILARSALRIGRRVACGVIAAVFMFFALIGFHALLWAIFVDAAGLSHIKAALCVIGVDIFFGLIFGLGAAWSIPGNVEIEARIRRDRKWIEFKQAVAVNTVGGLFLGPIARLTGRKATAILRNIFGGGR